MSKITLLLSVVLSGCGLYSDDDAPIEEVDAGPDVDAGAMIVGDYLVTWSCVDDACALLPYEGVESATIDRRRPDSTLTSMYWKASGGGVVANHLGTSDGPCLHVPEGFDGSSNYNAYDLCTTDIVLGGRRVDAVGTVTWPTLGSWTVQLERI